MNEEIEQLLQRILLPSAVFMSKLNLRAKLLSLFGILMVPLIILAFYAVYLEQVQVNVARDELKGIEVAQRTIDVMILAQKHRGIANLKLLGDKVDDDLAKVRQSLKISLDELDKVIAKYPELSLQDEWKGTEEELRAFASGKLAANAKDSFTQHTRVISQILRFTNYSNEQSGLLLDPEAASYFLMDIAVEKLPDLIEEIAVLRGQGAGFIRANTMEYSQKVTLISGMDGLQHDIQAIININPGLKRAGEKIPAEQQLASDAVNGFNEIIRKRLLKVGIDIQAADFFKEGTQAIDRVFKYQQTTQKRLTDILQKRERSLIIHRNLVFTVLFATLALATYLAFGFYRGFMQALQSVGAAATSVASGDLTNKIRIDGQDELARTGDILEGMNFNLSALVANVRTNSSMVSQLGQQLAMGIGDLAVRTEQQASSLDDTSTNVEDLAATVQKNAQAAVAVDHLATNLSEIAERSGDTMRSAVETMKGIQNSSLRVQEIVSIIDGIAFQTNILALNAAVEAARAGEQGRGFAVVATEVRDLAQRSATSAKQIRRLIDESVTRVESGVIQIDEVSEKLNDIVEGIRELALNVNSISNSSNEQSAGLAQISEAIHDLDRITKSNGEMADQAKTVSTTLEERATQLAQAVASFKLRQGTADEAYTLVKKAVGLYKVSQKTALQTITDDPEHIYEDRDMYVFAFNRHGEYLAFAGNPSKVKTNLLAISGFDGQKLVRDAFALPLSGGWIDYSIVNPQTQRIETKSSYIERVEDDIVIGCGVFKVN